MRPGIIIFNIGKHLGSEKSKFINPLLEKTNSVKGTHSKKESSIPAEITPWTLSNLFSDLYFIIILETVIGIPDDVTVIKSPRTEREIWYKPSPSAPKVLDRKIR